MRDYFQHKTHVVICNTNEGKLLCHDKKALLAARVSHFSLSQFYHHPAK